MDECLEFLENNPNSEYYHQGTERIKLLSNILIVDESVEEESFEPEFIKEFNLLYATKKYEEAFLLCLNSIGNSKLSALAYEKSSLVTPFLLAKGIIPMQKEISVDLIIELLLANGYKNFVLRDDGVLNVVPSLHIRVENGCITLKIAPILLVFVLLYPLLPFTLPFLITCLSRKKKIFKAICESLLHHNFK